MQNTVIHGRQGSTHGIPISLLLKQMAKPKDGEERHNFNPITIANIERPAEDVDDQEMEYLKSVEQDFSGISGDILDRLNLSHMRKK